MQAYLLCVTAVFGMCTGVLPRFQFHHRIYGLVLALNYTAPA